MQEGSKNEPTIAVFSYHALTSFINQLQYIAPHPVRILVIDCMLKDVLEKARNMEKNGEADVFLSAGGTAKLLSGNLSNPLVEIKVTGFDILAALKEDKLYSDTVGLITYESKIPYLENLSGLLNISIQQYTYQRISDIEEILTQLQNEAVKVVIGGSFLQEVISNKGIKGIFIYSSDGVTRALDTAVQIAFSKKAEARKAEELRAILAFSYEGIIFLA